MNVSNTKVNSRWCALIFSVVLVMNVGEALHADSLSCDGMVVFWTHPGSDEVVYCVSVHGGRVHGSYRDDMSIHDANCSSSLGVDLSSGDWKRVRHNILRVIEVLEAFDEQSCKPARGVWDFVFLPCGSNPVRFSSSCLKLCSDSSAVIELLTDFASISGLRFDPINLSNNENK